MCASSHIPGKQSGPMVTRGAPYRRERGMTTLGLAIFIVSLLFGQKIFSGSKTAQLYGTGLNTVVVLLGGATGAFGDGAGTDMYVRLLQIGAACLYIVGALALAEDWLKGDQPAKKVQAAPG